MAVFEAISAVCKQRVFDEQDCLVGRIHDVLIDFSEGRIEYVEITIPGGSQSDDSRVVVPWSAIRRRMPSGRLTVAARLATLRRMAHLALNAD